MELQYKIKEGGFDDIKKKLILRSILFAVPGVLGAMVLSYYVTNDQSSGSNDLLFIVPFILVLMIFGLLRGIKRQKELFNSYTLVIDEEKVIRRQMQTPDIEIPFSEIKEIIENKDGTYTIKGEKTRNVIGIPFQIEKLDELKTKLSAIVEITSGNDKKNLIQKLLWTLPLIVIVLMVTVVVSENKIIVGLAGASLTIGLIYSLISSQRSKYIDSKTKRRMWLVLIALSSIVTVTCFKVFGVS